MYLYKSGNYIVGEDADGNLFQALVKDSYYKETTDYFTVYDKSVLSDSIVIEIADVTSWEKNTDGDFYTLDEFREFLQTYVGAPICCSDSFAVLNAIDVEGEEFDTDGQILIWNQTTGKFEAGTISSENIGNADLLITDNVRKLKLAGGTSGQSWGVYSTDGSSEYFKVDGSGATKITGVVGINNAPDPFVAMYVNAGSLAYGMYVQGTNIGGTFQSSGGAALVASGTTGIDATGTNYGGIIYGANYGVYGLSPLIGARIRELTGGREVLISTQGYAIDVVSGRIRNQTPEVYADNASAITGGLAIGDFYNTPTGEMRIVV